MDAERQLERIRALARDDEEVLAVILFGSRARGDHHAGSDVDVCLVLTQGKREAVAVGRILLAYASAVDRDRILVKLDEMDGYLAELRSIMPSDLAEYRRVEKRRACEQLADFAEFRRQILRALPTE